MFFFVIGFLGCLAAWAMWVLFLMVFLVVCCVIFFFGVVVLTLGCCAGCDVFWRGDGVERILLL